MKRILGIDYGSVRVGLALSDPLGITAQPLRVLANKKGLLEEILKVCSERGVEEILVGMPTNLAGKATAQTEKVRAFVAALKQSTAVPVIIWDERLSTKAVERTLISAGLSREKRKKVIDASAAAYILQGYLDHEKKSI